MSYILNALRKSEQERRAAERPEIGASALASPPEQKRSFPWLVVSLILINVLTIGYFIWSRQREETPASPIPATHAITENKEKLTRGPAPTQSNSEIDKPLTLERPEPISPVFKKMTPASVPISISELMKERRNRIKKSPKDKPVGNVHTKFEQNSTQKIPAVPKDTEKNLFTPSMNPAPYHAKMAGQPPTTTLPDDQPSSTKALDPLHSKVTDYPHRNGSEAPLLQAMSPEFRRQVPKLNVNVFVYDENRDERFVIIDMTKYKEGQTIGKDIKLEEILPDSFLVKYNGKKFRIRRP